MIGRFRNIKTGVEYFACGVVTNATNAQDGEQMVIYHRSAGDQTFVREMGEFTEKFKRVAPGGEE